MKQFGKFFSLFVVFVAIAALAGCAGVKGALTGDTHDRVITLETQNKALADQLMGLSAQAATKAERTEMAAVREEMTKISSTLAEVKKRDEANTSAIASLQSSLVAKAEKAEVAAAQKRITELDVAAYSKLAALEKRVVGVRAMAAGVIGRVGALEDTQGVDHDKRLLRLSGFPTAKYDEKEGKLTACVETSEGMKKKIAEVAALKKTGWEVKAVAGFADERPFKDRTGKILEKSDEFNSKCATARAEAVAKALGVDVAKAKGHGVTTKFGGQDMNRSALSYLERKPLARREQVQTIEPRTHFANSKGRNSKMSNDRKRCSPRVADSHILGGRSGLRWLS